MKNFYCLIKLLSFNFRFLFIQWVCQNDGSTRVLVDRWLCWCHGSCYIGNRVAGGCGELEPVAVEEEEEEEEAGEGGDENREEVGEVGRGRDEVRENAEEEEAAEGGY